LADDLDPADQRQLALSINQILASRSAPVPELPVTGAS
jgi:hypothetical protein